MNGKRIVQLKPRATTSSPLDLAIGRAIAHHRRALQLSEDVLAFRIGREPEFVSAIEAGERRISPAMLVEIAQALGMSGTALLRSADGLPRRHDA